MQVDVHRAVNSLKSKGWLLSVANAFTNEHAFHLLLDHYNEIEVDGRPPICEYLEHLIQKGRAMKPRTISTVLIVLLLSGCAGRNATEIGTANGALLGAATGAAIGNQQNNALAGAMIGASTGAIAGNVIGGQIDRSNDSYETKFRADQQVLRERVDKNAVTLDQVLQMSASLVSDEVIVNEINRRGIAAPLTIDEIIYLSKQNVSPEVIKGYQNAGSRAQTPNGSPPYLSGNEVGTVELGRRYHDHSPHYNESNSVRRRSGFYFGIGN